LKINNTTQNIILILENGNNLGEISLQKAEEIANNENLDVVPVGKNGILSVCKLMNIGKHKYIQKKNKKYVKKQIKKEVKIRPCTEVHDILIKVNQIRKFISKGNFVKVSMRFRGRENAHKEIGVDVLKNILEQLKDIANEHKPINIDGNQSTMELRPK